MWIRTDNYLINRDTFFIREEHGKWFLYTEDSNQNEEFLGKYSTLDEGKKVLDLIQNYIKYSNHTVFTIPNDKQIEKLK